MNARARWTGLAGAGVVALLALSGVSCKKGDVAEPTSPITVTEFKATAEGHAGDSKTGLNGLDVYWTYGDDTRVFSDTDGDGKRYVADGGFGTAKTDFKEAGDPVSGNEFYAVYPYGAANDELTNKKVSVTIPAVQTYEAGSFANGANVMAAYTTSDKLAFEYKNVCGVLRLTLKGGATVKSIAVRSKSGEALSGKGTITFDDSGKPSLSIDGSEGESAVCLLCPGGVRLTGDGVQFNIVVKPCDMTGGFDVLVMCDEGSFRTSTSQNNPISAGHILGMPAVSVSVTEGALPGVFSVGDGETVRFSKGNLQFHTTDHIWRFAANQYDLIDDKPTSHTTSDYDDNTDKWIDLFGWGTSGHNHNNGCYQPWSTDADNSKYYAYGDEGKNLGDEPGEADWGYNAISNGGAVENKWHTLSTGELTYLINNTGGTQNTRTGARYAKATVCGVAGLLVFPDGVGVSSNKATVGGFTIENVNVRGSGAAFDSPNNFGATDWACLEACGCVFLPCAGYRTGTTVYNVGSYGSYWSSTAGSSGHAYSLYIYSDTVGPASNLDRCNGRSVRLVC